MEKGRGDKKSRGIGGLEPPPLQMSGYATVGRCHHVITSSLTLLQSESIRHIASTGCLQIWQNEIPRVFKVISRQL